MVWRSPIGNLAAYWEVKISFTYFSLASPALNPVCAPLVKLLGGRWWGIGLDLDLPYVHNEVLQLYKFFILVECYGKKCFYATSLFECFLVSENFKNISGCLGLKSDICQACRVLMHQNSACWEPENHLSMPHNPFWCHSSHSCDSILIWTDTKGIVEDTY